jgi:hypothetical protein
MQRRQARQGESQGQEAEETNEAAQSREPITALLRIPNPPCAVFYAWSLYGHH